MEIDNIFEMLKRELIGASGQSVFTLNNISIKLKSRDSIGNLLQEWLEEWFKLNNIKYYTLKNTQEFPDYHLYTKNDEIIELEVESWNYDASPAFDLANFESYISTVEKDPNKLFAKYLVFAYSLDDKGEIIIKDLFLKNIWELTGPSTIRPLTVQVKREIIYNIRPKNFTNPNIDVFKTPLEFIEAVRDQMIDYDENKKDMDSWYSHMKNKLNL